MFKPVFTRLAVLSQALILLSVSYLAAQNNGLVKPKAISNLVSEQEAFKVGKWRNIPSQVLKLTPEEFLQKVSKTSLDASLARFDMLSAMANFHEARDAYSTLITGSAVGALPASSNQFQTNLGFTLGIQRSIPETGTAFSASFGGSYFAQTPVSNTLIIGASTLNSVTTNTATPVIVYSTLTSAERTNTNQVSPALNGWKNSLSFTISQSLLRGGPFSRIGGASLDILRSTVRLQRSVYNTKLGGVMTGALQALLNYDLNQKLLQLTEESIVDAKDTLERNKRRVDLGTVEIVDVYTAEVNLTLSLNSRDQIVRDLENGKAQIAYLLGVTNIDDLEVVLKEPLTYLPTNFDEDKIYETALANRKEIEQARIGKETARLALYQARVALMPKLDLSLTLKLTGWDTNNASFSDALANLGSDKYANGIEKNLALTFETPLEPWAYGTVVEKRTADFKKAQETERQVRDDLKKIIHNHMETLSYLQKVLARTKETLDLSDKKVAELKRQFNNGKINSDRYLRGYEDQRIIQRTFYSTLFSYELEKAALLGTQGIFLKSFGIKEADVNASFF